MKTRRRLSIPRLLVALVGFAAVTGLIYLQASSAYARLTEPAVSTWFAPYVDATVAPTFQFEDPLVSPARYFALGFIVADPRQSCSPSWGTYFSLNGADQELDLDRRIARLRARGGDIIVSFGGAANQELAVACPNATSLFYAYRDVVERYGVRTIDFDIEGTALADVQANGRRLVALRELQQWSQKVDRPLNIWLTLPVAPSGLTLSGVQFIDQMLTSGIHIAGVNIMTMDYGGALPRGESMWQGAQSALIHTHSQLVSAFRQAGTKLTATQVWRRMGATPMLGQNDVPGEYFSLDDTNSLVAFARQHGLARVSMWSANRDAPCSANANTTVVSDVCNGVHDAALDYTWAFTRLNAALPDRVSLPATFISARPASRDNPLLSPYPIWDQSLEYRAGAKVVWHGEVYQAKWDSLDFLPDQTVSQPWDTPWRDLGPVLPSDAQSGTTNIPLAPWNTDQVYLEGDQVTFDGYVFQAKWWTQGEQPDKTPLRPADASWQPLHPVSRPHPKNHHPNAGKHH